MVIENKILLLQLFSFGKLLAVHQDYPKLIFFNSINNKNLIYFKSVINSLRVYAICIMHILATF